MEPDRIITYVLGAIALVVVLGSFVTVSQGFIAVVTMFGKYRRMLPLDEIVKKDAPYLKWLLKSDFSDEIKQLLQSALQGQLPERK